MKSFLTIAALFSASALLPATVQAGGGYGHHGPHGGYRPSPTWGHGHHHHHGYRPYYGNYGWRPVYRPYPTCRTYPYSTGFSLSTPNAWIQSGW